MTKKAYKYVEGPPTEAPRPGQMVAIDTEWFGQEKNRLHRPHGKFACMTIAFGSNVYLVDNYPDVRKALKVVGPGLWVMQNAGYDITQIGQITPIEERPIFDTALVEKVLYSGYYSAFALNDMARRYFDTYMAKDVRDTFGEDTRHVLTREQKHYAADDAWYTLKIAKAQAQALDKEGLAHIYWDVDAPTIWCVEEFLPAKINVKLWLELGIGFGERGVAMETEVGQELYGEAIRVNTYSYEKLRLILSDHLGEILPNTQAGTLEAFSEDPIIAKVLDIRSLRKMGSTYGEKWAERSVEEGDLVYASFNETGTATGRMSCTNPNLFQIPKRDARGLGFTKYRECFISQYPKGKIIATDVSQQEVRILAHLSQDKNLIKILTEGGDTHQAVADLIGRDRLLGKNINLGLGYGLTAHGLARNANIPLEEAEAALAVYFKNFPGVGSYIAHYRNQGYVKQMVHTPLGRRYHVNIYNDQWQNNAINSPVQGGGADHLKLTLNLLRKECKLAGLPYPVVIPVYDEIMADSPPEHVKTYQKMIEEAWVQTGEALFDSVPMKVDTHVGATWKAKDD